MAPSRPRRTRALRPTSASRGPRWRAARRRLGLLLCLAGLTAPARADDAVDIISRDLFARKGALACNNADDAADGGSSLFSSCFRMPYAVRVELVNPPDPTAKVFFMRFVGFGDRPLTAWFDRAGLTNAPRPGERGPTR